VDYLIGQMGKTRNSILLVILTVSIASLGLTTNQAFAGGPVSPFPVHIPLPTTGPIGDFKCWSFPPGGEPFPPTDIQPNAIIDVVDQFGEMLDIQVGQGVEFCASAIKNGDPGPFGVLQHYVGYSIINNPPISPLAHDWTVPQFGLTIPDVTLTQPSELLVPSAKEGFPNLTDLHYKCYEYDGPFVSLNQVVNLQTQFSVTDDLIGELILLCNPAIKTDSVWIGGAGPVFGALIPEHLACFLIETSDTFSKKPIKQSKFGNDLRYD